MNPVGLNVFTTLIGAGAGGALSVLRQKGSPDGINPLRVAKGAAYGATIGLFAGWGTMSIIESHIEAKIGLNQFVSSAKGKAKLAKALGKPLEEVNKLSTFQLERALTKSEPAMNVVRKNLKAPPSSLSRTQRFASNFLSGTYKAAIKTK